MKKSFHSYTAAATAALALTASGALAQNQPVSDARVRELLVQAQAGVQQPAAQGAPAAAPAAAQTIDITMEEAVAKAVDQNIDLSVARLTPQIQDFTLSQARAAYAPTLQSTFGQNSRTTQSTNQISGGQIVTNKTLTYNAGVTQQLPWLGSTASFNWTNNRADTDSNITTFNPSYNSAMVAQLVQPILRNRAIDATRQSILTGEINRRLADVSLRATTINTIANTRNAYWDLVYATQAVDASRQSLALAQKLVEDNRSRVEIGTMAPIDVVSAQSEAASRELALVQAIANRQTAELSLKRLLVAGTSDPMWNGTLNPTDRPPTGEGDKIDVEAALRKALAERTDIIQARENLRISDVSLKYMRNQSLPGLDLTASYQSSGTGGTRLLRSAQLGGEVIDRFPGGYSDALSMLRRAILPTWNLQVVLSYPIGTSAQEANYARARVQYQQSQAQIRSLELRVATEITNAALTVNSNIQQVQASIAARELRTRQLEAAQSKFEVGMATNYEVVQAQRDLTDARNAELRAILNYRKSLVDFQRLQETSSSGSTGVTTVSGSTTGASTGSTSGATGGASGFTGSGFSGGGF